MRAVFLMSALLADRPPANGFVGREKCARLRSFSGSNVWRQHFAMMSGEEEFDYV
jgi:hypothetical protein